jgi:hypothetical protein
MSTTLSSKIILRISFLNAMNRSRTWLGTSHRGVQRLAIMNRFRSVSENSDQVDSLDLICRVRREWPPMTLSQPEETRHSAVQKLAFQGGPTTNLQGKESCPLFAGMPQTKI